jgi:DNA invertase Pin-like site-specific DNA recombinase
MTQRNDAGSACAPYARASSDAQDVDLLISAQLKALRKHAAKEGWPVATEYIDEANGTKTDKGPTLRMTTARNS